jgi:hypothetical protein
MFRGSHTIFGELNIRACQSYTLFKECVINSVVMWLHTCILVGPGYCVHVALFGR